MPKKSGTSQVDKAAEREAKAQAKAAEREAKAQAKEADKAAKAQAKEADKAAKAQAKEADKAAKAQAAGGGQSKAKKGNQALQSIEAEGGTVRAYSAKAGGFIDWNPMAHPRDSDGKFKDTPDLTGAEAMKARAELVNRSIRSLYDLAKSYSKQSPDTLTVALIREARAASQMTDDQLATMASSKDKAIQARAKALRELRDLGPNLDLALARSFRRETPKDVAREIVHGSADPLAMVRAVKEERRYFRKGAWADTVKRAEANLALVSQLLSRDPSELSLGEIKRLNQLGLKLRADLAIITSSKDRSKAHPNLAELDAAKLSSNLRALASVLPTFKGMATFPESLEAAGAWARSRTEGVSYEVNGHHPVHEKARKQYAYESTRMRRKLKAQTQEILRIVRNEPDVTSQSFQDWARGLSSTAMFGGQNDSNRGLIEVALKAGNKKLAMELIKEGAREADRAILREQQAYNEWSLGRLARNGVEVEVGRGADKRTITKYGDGRGASVMTIPAANSKLEDVTLLGVNLPPEYMSREALNRDLASKDPAEARAHAEWLVRGLAKAVADYNAENGRGTDLHHMTNHFDLGPHGIEFQGHRFELLPNGQVSYAPKFRYNSPTIFADWSAKFKPDPINNITHKAEGEVMHHSTEQTWLLPWAQVSRDKALSSRMAHTDDLMRQETAKAGWNKNSRSAEETIEDFLTANQAQLEAAGLSREQIREKAHLAKLAWETEWKSKMGKEAAKVEGVDITEGDRMAGYRTSINQAVRAHLAKVHTEAIDDYIAGLPDGEREATRAELGAQYQTQMKLAMIHYSSFGGEKQSQTKSLVAASIAILSYLDPSTDLTSSTPPAIMELAARKRLEIISEARRKREYVVKPAA